MTIKEAITNFLNRIKAPIEERDISKALSKFSKAKKQVTRERGINRSLNALWRKGKIEKYYLKDDDLIPYPEKKGVRINRKYPRLYSDIIPIKDKEYQRVGLSDVVYCGTGQVRKEKHGVSIVTYVNPKDYQDQDFRSEVEDHLKTMLLNYLQVNFPDCFYAGSNEYVNRPDIKSTTTELVSGTDNYSLDDYQLERNPAFIYPETDVSEE
jgi:hypothetical protein